MVQKRFEQRTARLQVAAQVLEEFTLEQRIQHPVDKTIDVFQIVDVSTVKFCTCFSHGCFGGRAIDRLLHQVADSGAKHQSIDFRVLIGKAHKLTGPGLQTEQWSSVSTSRVVTPTAAQRPLTVIASRVDSCTAALAAFNKSSLTFPLW
jgi:hypothetical protein